jgi:hypothetical protein
MLFMLFRRSSVHIAVYALFSLATPAAAYPVDCAILLCLSGGWPGSAECTHARSVFIARITPWPIEPPLQIWNCPMHAALAPQNFGERLLRVAGREIGPQLEQSEAWNPVPSLQRVRQQADVDISSPAFDFVRSIHVFEIHYMMGENSDGDCNRWSSIFRGSYGPQGDYHRERSDVEAIPEASGFAIPADCPNYNYRAVFVEWRDAQGKYGSEEVHY